MKSQFAICPSATPLKRQAICSNNRLRSAGIALLCAIAFSAPAQADTITDINALMRSGQFSEALSKTDATLLQSPRDKQMRFLKGVLLTELNRPSEAIVVFSKLTEDFPELPEPYNNLAVLFASNGQYDKARAALEMAIRTNPTYATAHENLGDVYAKLASQAYDKALQLDSANTTAKSKLTLIRTLVGNSNNAAAGNNVDTKSAASAMAAGNPNAKQAAATASAAKAVTVAMIKPQPKADVAKEATKAETKPDNKQDVKAEEKSAVKAIAADPERDEVLAVVNSWAKAWSAKDVASYLSYYGSDFQPANGQPHKAWAQDRRVRIEDKGTISVKIDGAKVAIDGNTATVRFRQQYVSNQLRSNGPKTLVLSKQAGKWQIRQERAGS